MNQIYIKITWYFHNQSWPKSHLKEKSELGWLLSHCVAQAGLHLVISLPLSPPHAGVVAPPPYSPPSSHVKIEVNFEFSTQFISIYWEALSFPFFLFSFNVCSWLCHGWVPETIPGKPYTHHGCLETIPSLFSKNVPEYLDHLVVTRGGKLHTGKKGEMFWNKLDITPALLVIF